MRRVRIALAVAATIGPAGAARAENWETKVEGSTCTVRRYSGGMLGISPRSIVFSVFRTAEEMPNDGYISFQDSSGTEDPWDVPVRVVFGGKERIIKGRGSFGSFSAMRLPRSLLMEIASAKSVEFFRGTKRIDSWNLNGAKDAVAAMLEHCGGLSQAQAQAADEAQVRADARAEQRRQQRVQDEMAANERQLCAMGACLSRWQPGGDQYRGPGSGNGGGGNGGGGGSTGGGRYAYCMSIGGPGAGRSYYSAVFPFPNNWGIGGAAQANAFRAYTESRFAAHNVDVHCGFGESRAEAISQRDRAMAGTRQISDVVLTDWKYGEGE